LFIEKILKADGSETSYFHSINKKFEWSRRNHKEKMNERADGNLFREISPLHNVSSQSKTLKSIEKLLEHENHLFFSFRNRKSARIEGIVPTESSPVDAGFRRFSLRIAKN
jgi:hypothetical protein